MGMVAPSAHQSGRKKSAIRPRMVNVAQKIFRSMYRVYSFRGVEAPPYHNSFKPN